VLIEIAFSFPSIVLTIILMVSLGLSLITFLGIFDFDFDVDIDADNAAGPISGLFSTFGLTGVPPVFVLGLVSLCAWAFSVLLVAMLPAFLFKGVLVWIVGSAILFGTIFASLPIVSFLIRPLRKVMKIAYQGAPEKVLIGKECRVRSSRVDEGFGEGEVTADGAGLVVQIRSKEGTLKHNDTVVITEKNSDFYWVTSKEKFNLEINNG